MGSRRTPAPRPPTTLSSRPRRSGSRTRGVPEDRLAVVRVRFRVAEDIGLRRFTETRPTVQCVVSVVQRLNDGEYLVEFEIISSEPRDYTEELASMPAITSAKRQSPIGHRTHYLITLALTPGYMVVATELGALLRYPRVIENGHLTVEVVAPTSRLRALIRRLRQIASDVEVLRFGPGPMRSSLGQLNARQTALLHRALAAGYFDVPRRVTLTRFAETLGRGKSSVSRALALIEKRLAESSVASATPPHGPASDRMRGVSSV